MTDKLFAHRNRLVAPIRGPNDVQPWTKLNIANLFATRLLPDGKPTDPEAWLCHFSRRL
jgi:hypothetical protein